MDKSRGYYGKWKTSDQQRKTLYDVTYMQNLKSKTNNKQNKNRRTSLGGPVVKNPPSNAGDTGSSSQVREWIRSHMLQSNKVQALQILSDRTRTVAPPKILQATTMTRGGPK